MTEDMTTELDDDDFVLVIGTEADSSRHGYHVTLNFGDGRSARLMPSETFEHAKSCFAAIARAEYDAAVMEQLTRKVGLELQLAASMVVDMRKDRIDLHWPTILTAEPCVSEADSGFHSYLTLHLDGEPIAQLDMAGAREHASAMLEVSHVADLDSSYRRVMVTHGIENDRAMAMVADLAVFREDW